MTADDYAGAQATLSRVLGPTSTPDIWDPDLKLWRSAAAVDPSSVKGVALIPPKAGGAPWEGVLTGAGQKDAAGVPVIQPAIASFPQYHLRGVFRARRGSIDGFGLGPDSAPIQFASAIAASRFAADLTPDADTATRARIVLRNGAAQTVGVLDIDASGGNTVLTLANFNTAGAPLASITLRADGGIVLTPRGGMNVVVDGDLEANRIRYLPAAAVTKVDLNWP
jgi:hypothetical protein